MYSKLTYHTDSGELYSEINYELTEFSAFSYAYNLSHILPYHGVSLYNREFKFKLLIEEILIVIMPDTHPDTYIYSYLTSLALKYKYDYKEVKQIYDVIYGKLQNVHDLPVCTLRGWGNGYTIVMSELT